MKQAPAWNAVVKEFANHKDVSFADVNLQEAQVRGNYNPGAGGWPTVRHFNTETGKDGKQYAQKTSQSVCDELGPKTEYLKEYVQEYVQACLVSDPSGCSERETSFIATWSKKPADEVASQLKRLRAMPPSKMKPDLAKWLKQRTKILTQLEGGVKTDL